MMMLEKLKELKNELNKVINELSEKEKTDKLITEATENFKTFKGSNYIVEIDKSYEKSITLYEVYDLILTDDLQQCRLFFSQYYKASSSSKGYSIYRPSKELIGQTYVPIKSLIHLFNNEVTVHFLIPDKKLIDEIIEIVENGIELQKKRDLLITQLYEFPTSI